MGASIYAVLAVRREWVRTKSRLALSATEALAAHAAALAGTTAGTAGGTDTVAPSAAAATDGGGEKKRQR